MENEHDPIRSYGLLGDAPVGEHYTWDAEDAANTDGLDRMAFVEVLAEAAVNTGDTLTIGVYGDWGEGKTSLMYLMKQVVDKDRNAIGVWFNAWQYEREDHLIVPLIATITRDINEALEKREGKSGKLSDTIVEGAKSLKNALRAIAYGFSFKGKVEVPLLAGAEVGFSGKDAIERYQNLANDISLEKSLYFDSFEKLRAIKNSDKMPKIVVFIDDLDRCLPDAAVRLLENVKLVLNVPSFSFVLGIAPTVIQKFVERKFSTDLGLPESYFRNYLDKFIQVPIHLPRKDGDGFETYVKRLLETKGVLNLEEKMAFTNMIGLIATISDHNPRSAVRAINRILVLNRIATKQGQEVPVTDLAFASALQLRKSVFLSGLICFPWLSYSNSIRAPETTRFQLHELEEIGWPSGLKSEMDFSEGITLLLEYTKTPSKESSFAWKIGRLSTVQNDPEVAETLKWLADNKHICWVLRRTDGLNWLRDKKRIANSFNFTEVIQQSSFDSIEKRVCEQGEDPLRIPEILAKIKENWPIPFFARRFVKDLTPLCQFPQLTRLDLSGCSHVMDLKPLSTLSQLIELDLSTCTDVRDLEPLSTLSKLRTLNLDGCKNISNFTPLFNLSELRNLNLGDCRNFTDLKSLATLSQLTELTLWNLAVTNLDPLSTLSKLTKLDLYNCKRLTNLDPLATLSQLTYLSLCDCKNVTDINPIAKLSKLAVLSLRGCTKVTNLEPLTRLKQLESLNLRNCEGVTGFKSFSYSNENPLEGTPLQRFLSELREKTEKAGKE